MKDRTRIILEAAVGDYIQSGHPVTSDGLFQVHNFGIKPAMIRWELNDLSEGGYFYQTHPSGGRFPTNRAYRFYVEYVLQEVTGVPSIAQGPVRMLVEQFLAGDRERFIHAMAARLNALSVGYDVGENAIYESGLHELLEHVDVERKDDLVEVVNDFEHLPQRITERPGWWQGRHQWPSVFIGQSPVTRSEHLSVIAGLLRFGRKSFLLMAVGPKRMDYGKSVGLFRTVANCLQGGRR